MLFRSDQASLDAWEGAGGADRDVRRRRDDPTGGQTDLTQFD